MYSREGACWKAGNERGGTQTSVKEGETENKKDKIAKSEKNGGVCAPVWVFFPPHLLGEPSALLDSSTMSYCLSAFTTWFTSYDFSHFTGRTHKYTHRDTHMYTPAYL